MLWPDLTYDDESLRPDGSPRPVPDKVEFDRELFDHYRRLIALRRALPALREGDFRTLLTDDARDLYVFARSTPAQTIIVALNRGTDKQGLLLTPPNPGTWLDVLNDSAPRMLDGQISIELDGLWAAVLVST